MHKTHIAVVGAGPAGLAAAIEARKAGATVTLIDENTRPGGQLFKQIHKFFGSKEHQAGVRGIHIGQDLLHEAQAAGVEIMLDTTVYGLYEDNCLGLVHRGHTSALHAEKIIIATGAKEKALAFPGWTLPGVMGAGAAQTLTNIHRVLPGRRILMVGAGNVGLIVGYQLLQAGADLVAVIEAMPAIGGYGVHSSKLRRAGVPILTSHTILAAEGEDSVRRAVIAQLDEHGRPIAGSERVLDVDTVCLAVGLDPMIELLWMAGVQVAHSSNLGGWLPVHDQNMQTSIPGLYVAGDVAGVEEASVAIEEGRLAGLATSQALGCLPFKAGESAKAKVRSRLEALRMGSFGERRSTAKKRIEVGDLTDHRETRLRRVESKDGLATVGVPSFEELRASPGFPGADDLAAGPMVVIECIEDIPCNPCEAVCLNGAIVVGDPVTNLPVFYPNKCDACARCIPACPGQAIFLVDMTFSAASAAVSFPYEFYPLPSKGDTVQAVDRAGTVICQAEVLRVQRPKSFDQTAVITVAVPRQHAMQVRSMQRLPVLTTSGSGIRDQETGGD